MVRRKRWDGQAPSGPGAGTGAGSVQQQDGGTATRVVIVRDDAAGPDGFANLRIISIRFRISIP